MDRGLGRSMAEAFVTQTVLVTGGDGYLGSRTALRLLSDSDAAVILFVHANSEGERTSKHSRLSTRFAAYANRVSFAFGELARDSALSELPTESITGIVHTAAVTTFNVDQQTAQNVNVDGTRRLAEFARRCSRLESFLHLSTIYVSGLTAGHMPEALLDTPAQFANHYEASKFRSEILLSEQFRDLPWRIVRLATVIADDDSGNVGQFNVVHRILRLLYLGLLPIVPGEQSVPLHFITGHFAINALMKLRNDLPVHEVLHLCHAAHEAPSLKSLLDMAYECFLEDRDFVTRRVLKPLLTDEYSFAYMADHIEMFSAPAFRQAVSLMRPFAKQMFVTKQVCNTKVATLSDYSAPDFQRLVKAVGRWLLAEHWMIATLDSPTANPMERVKRVKS